MTTLATVVSPFVIVVIVVGVLGLAAGLLILIRGPSASGDERGQLWIFHGEPDTGPHQSSGAREHDRHVLDPEPGIDAPYPLHPPRPRDETVNERYTSSPAPAGQAPESTASAQRRALDELAAQREQATPPSDS